MRGSDEEGGGRGVMFRYVSAFFYCSLIASVHFYELCRRRECLAEVSHHL